jgi:AcrR family transcriptional regulator
MARKATISKQDIQKAAFSLASDEGIEQVTARKLAARAGCSTQPIFRVYRNMEELQEDVFRLAVGDFHAFYRVADKKE